MAARSLELAIRDWLSSEHMQEPPILESQSGVEYLDRIECEFGVQAAFYVRGPPEAMLLARKKEVADSIAVAPQRLDHDLRLVWRHDSILGALEEYDWLGKSSCVVKR
jgi:hypothetical protein